MCLKRFESNKERKKETASLTDRDRKMDKAILSHEIRLKTALNWFPIWEGIREPSNAGGNQ